MSRFKRVVVVTVITGALAAAAAAGGGWKWGHCRDGAPSHPQPAASGWTWD